VVVHTTDNSADGLNASDGVPFGPSPRNADGEERGVDEQQGREGGADEEVRPPEIRKGDTRTSPERRSVGKPSDMY